VEVSMDTSVELQQIASLHARLGSLGTRLGWIAAFLLLLVGWRVFTTLAPNLASADSPSEHIEYRVESFGDDEWTSAAKGPNRLGAEGWEIIYVRRVETGAKATYECILRRKR
jgi:hypothetical protein